MGWKFCSGCKRQYNDSNGGCTNGSCSQKDGAAIQRSATMPRPPTSQAELNQEAAAVGRLVSKAPIEPMTVGPSTPGRRPSSPALLAMPLSSAIALPLAVAASTPAVLAADPAPGTFVVFRGDSRTPSAIRAAGGFKPWGRPNSLEQIRGLISRLTTNSANDDFAFSIEKSGGRQHPLEQALKTPIIHVVSKKPVAKTLLNLSKFIIGLGSGQNFDAFHVSTAPSVDCGGYGNQGYIYRIEFPQTFHFFNQAGEAVEMTAARKGVDLVMADHADLAQATVIGLVIGGSPGGKGETAFPDIVEVSLLTPIPLARVKAYQPQGGGWFSL
ncbi:MAG: hypothetical protein ACJ8GJ_17455 [Vitreoscilla sp.]